MSIKLSDGKKIKCYRIEQTEDGIECDICGKFIKADGDWNSRKDRKYCVVRTGHNDWGHDSCESVESKDICPECIGKFITDYLKNGSNTAWIEIETMITYPRKHWKECHTSENDNETDI
jgi:hypothetical protein